MQKNNRTILFLCPYPRGHAPSQRFRFEQYLDTLVAAGFTIDFRPFVNEAGWRILYTQGNLVRKLLFMLSGYMHRIGLLFTAVPRAHFVFIHREASPAGPPFLEYLIARILRKKVIYDFDDAIWLPNTSTENALAAGVKWHSKVASICRWSFVVSAGNSYLASFASTYNTRVVINPTTVDTENVHKSPARKEPSGSMVHIGWTGSHSTLKYLHLVESVMIQLEQEFPDKVRFVVIADRSPSLGLKNLLFVQWRKESEIADLGVLDIGIMPLTDDPWAKGKCGLKALQYMAMAIPTVASPVGVNTAIIDHGVTGYLCETPEAWLMHLRKLILEVDLRRQLGDAGRRKVVANYSTVSNRSTFLSLFE